MMVMIDVVCHYLDSMGKGQGMFLNDLDLDF